MSEDDDLLRHVIERQVVPALRAEELGGETRFVNTDPDAEGVEVACQGCGRTARMYDVTVEEAAAKVILCPDCLP
jgi:Fe-S cluster biogenesis protein NfuA